MWPRTSIPLLILSASACRADFDVARDTLGPFRIVGVSVEELGAECPVANAAIWSGYGPYHLVSPGLDWFLDGVPLGTGWDVPVCSEGELTLIARSSDGHEEQARLTVRPRETNRVLQREAVLLTDMDLETRRAVQGIVVDTTVPLGSGMRIQLQGLLDGDSVSWMSPENQAHVLPLDASTTDFLLEEWDEDEDGVVTNRQATEGHSSHFALVFDGNGGNDFFWIDALFGMEGVDFLRHEGRLIEAPGLAGTDELVATVEKTADGYILTDFAAGDGTPRFFDCMAGRTSFSLDWITNGRCGLDELDGNRVNLEIW